MFSFAKTEEKTKRKFNPGLKTLLTIPTTSFQLLESKINKIKVIKTLVLFGLSSFRLKINMNLS